MCSFVLPEKVVIALFWHWAVSVCAWRWQRLCKPVAFFFLSFDSSLVLRFSFVSVVTFFLYMKLYFPHFIRLNQIKEYQRMFHMNKKKKKKALKANGFLWVVQLCIQNGSLPFSATFVLQVFFLIHFPIGISKKSLLKKKKKIENWTKRQRYKTVYLIVLLKERINWHF